MHCMYLQIILNLKLIKFVYLKQKFTKYAGINCRVHIFFVFVKIICEILYYSIISMHTSS